MRATIPPKTPSLPFCAAAALLIFCVFLVLPPLFWQGLGAVFLPERLFLGATLAAGTLTAVFATLLARQVGIWDKLGFRAFLAKDFAFWALHLLPLWLVAIVVGDTQSAAFVSPLFFADPLWALLCVAIAAPLCEELIFRGAVFAFLRAALPWDALAGFASAFLFALAHGQYHGAAFWLVFGQGCVFSAARVASRSVWLAAVLHALNNTAALFVFLY